MNLKKSEFEAIHQAIDFISSNVDGADDQEYYINLLDNLRSVFNKYKAEKHNRLVKRYIKVELKKRNDS